MCRHPTNDAPRRIVSANIVVWRQSNNEKTGLSIFGGDYMVKCQNKNIGKLTMIWKTFVSTKLAPLLLALLLPIFTGSVVFAQSTLQLLETAKEYGNAGLHDKAIEILVPIAIDGDTRAQLLLGSVYISKRDEDNYMRGHSWAAKAAKGGEVGAFMLLWSTLELDPKLNNFNPHGEKLGDPLRTQYSLAILNMAVIVSKHNRLESLKKQKEAAYISRKNLSPAQAVEAFNIASNCVQSDFENCEPIELFITR